jgi:predicted transcriptional regulator
VGKTPNPTSVRLDASVLAKLAEVCDKEHRSANFLIRYAVLKFLGDYRKEGLRDEVLAKLA